jgi:hypothetical protein
MRIAVSGVLSSCVTGGDEVAPSLGERDGDRHHSIERDEAKHGRGQQRRRQSIDVPCVSGTRQRPQRETCRQVVERIGEPVLVDIVPDERRAGRRGRREG